MELHSPDSILFNFSGFNVSYQSISINAMGEDLARIFDQTQDLPGVLVFEDNLLVGMVPRYRFYEQLGRPFGTEIFLHRLIGELLQHMNLDILVLPVTTPINEAVKMAFSRPEGQRYDPIVVWMNEKEICVVDMHSLLLALSNTYENMNAIISKQMEIGKALSSAIDTPHLLSVILRQIQEILPCHTSAIFLEKDYGQQLDAYLSILDSKSTEQLFRSLKKYLRANFDEKLNDPIIAQIPQAIASPILTQMERMIMERHPRYAFDLLSTNIILKDYVDIPCNHHEHWDGSGYPRHLKGEDIPLPARIFTLVDVWDALLSDRPYRKAWCEKDVLDYLTNQSGRLFDPAVVKVFFDFIQKR